MKIFCILFCTILFCVSFLSAQDSALAKSMEQGKSIYNESCITCHMGNGEGVAGLFPPLAKADYLMNTPEKAIHAIKFGLKGKIIVNKATYDNMMPPIGLSDQEIADVTNYIKNSWGNSSKGKVIIAKMVEQIKE